jgi:DNA-binding GntR family transcriptional regulator
MMSGALSPGTRIPEARLAEELGVSRGTVRDALRQLQRERLIVWKARRSPHVRSLTQEEVEDIYQVRELLEGGAARTLAGLRPRDRARAVAALRAAYAELEVAAAASNAARINAELHFHETICALAGNTLLLQLWQELRPVIQLMLHCVPAPVLSEVTVDDHLELIAAIEAGEPPHAVAVVAAQFSGGAALFGPYVTSPAATAVRQSALGSGRSLPAHPRPGEGAGPLSAS